MREYKFKTEPFDHQRKVLEDSWSEKFYALFMEDLCDEHRSAVHCAGHQGGVCLFM